MVNSKQSPLKRFVKEGEPLIWLSGLGVILVLLMGLIFLSSIVKNGMVAYWPKALVQLETQEEGLFLGEINQESLTPAGAKRLQLKIGNRDFYSLDFKWIDEEQVAKRSFPVEAIAIERMEYGNFYGFVQGIHSPEGFEQGGAELIEKLQDLAEADLEALEEITSEIKAEATSMENQRLEIEELRYNRASAEKILKAEEELALAKTAFEETMERQQKIQAQLAKFRLRVQEVGGNAKDMPIEELVRHYQPNKMGLFGKIGHYLAKLAELFFSEPRESNTEGGLFPAIIGTVMLILTMSIFSFPLGVIAAIYLKEYAKPGPFVQSIRITVNNLAGVPSIVWGIFGLGFFVYVVGGGIDSLFFEERLPTPTFGTGGVLWASLTLALLTVPVVIVATEEALGSVPKDMRLGSLALGATKYQTLVRVILPMASPRIITGFILAMSRAAGEVAPLMITGVVKLAPSLPIDGTFPFVHLERKFMHLGFHIYDISFQSPNVEAAKPMVFVTTLLLLGVVIVMSSLSIYIRQKMKKKYAAKAF